VVDKASLERMEAIRKALLAEKPVQAEKRRKD
jgi:hypothetical protein